MSKTPFSSKVDILGNIWFLYKDGVEDHQEWQDFFEWGDLGLPLAYLAKYDFATVKPDGKRIIEECWTVLCEMLSVDPDARYDDLEHLFNASPNEPINAEG